MELAVQSNKNATILVMGSFFLVIGLHQQLLRHKSTPKTESGKPTVTLESLPYDVLLHVINYLDFFEVQNLQASSVHLYQYISTRPVYHNLALQLLRRSHALPLSGFERLDDLPIERLMHAVSKGYRMQRSWLTGTMRPACSNACPSQYLTNGHKPVTKSFVVVDTPADEGDPVDWVHSISHGYMLCATKGGRVICWDIHDSTYKAVWAPEQPWELWKCRIEYDTREVYFVMAKFHNADQAEAPLATDISLVCLKLPEKDPEFSTICSFTIPGLIQNVFLLDIPRRCFAAYSGLYETDCIGLFFFPDWSQTEYIFIDTDIDYEFPPNWTCILDEDDVVVHCEDRERLTQYCYPISLLQNHIQHFGASRTASVSTRLSTPSILTRPFRFPSPEFGTNPLTSPFWFPESAHFVRQWWPTLPNVAKLSCTVFVLVEDETEPGRPIRFTLAQHYFDVPVSGGVDPTDPTAAVVASSIDDGKPVGRMWFLSTPFEPVCEVEEEDHEMEGHIGKCQPLIAIDFGHAAWLEWVHQPDGSKVKQLRLVSFPPAVLDGTGPVPIETGENSCYGLEDEVEGRVVTLPVPEELDLDLVETINLDQSQGAVFLSVKGGRVFILCYD